MEQKCNDVWMYAVVDGKQITDVDEITKALLSFGDDIPKTNKGMEYSYMFSHAFTSLMNIRSGRMNEGAYNANDSNRCVICFEKKGDVGIVAWKPINEAFGKTRSYMKMDKKALKIEFELCEVDKRYTKPKIDEVPRAPFPSWMDVEIDGVKATTTDVLSEKVKQLITETQDDSFLEEASIVQMSFNAVLEEHFVKNEGSDESGFYKNTTFKDGYKEYIRIKDSVSLSVFTNDPSRVNHPDGVSHVIINWKDKQVSLRLSPDDEEILAYLVKKQKEEKKNAQSNM